MLCNRLVDRKRRLLRKPEYPVIPSWHLGSCSRGPTRPCAQAGVVKLLRALRKTSALVFHVAQRTAWIIPSSESYQSNLDLSWRCPLNIDLALKYVGMLVVTCQ